MGRITNAAFRSKLGESVLYPALFAEFEFDNATTRFWSGDVDISWNGHVWTGGGLLGSITLSGEADTIQARGLNFSLNFVDQSFYANAVQTEYRGRPVRLWFALMNAEGTSVEYSYLMEEARMDTMTVFEEGDTISLNLSCETRLIDMFHPNMLYLNSNDYHKIEPDDDFYSFVPGLAGSRLPWGLEIPKSLWAAKVPL